MVTKKKRRVFTNEQRKEVVDFAKKYGSAKTAKRYEVLPSQIYRWRKMLRRVKTLPVKTDAEIKGDAEKVVEAERRLNTGKPSKNSLASRVADITVRVNCDGLTLKMQSESGMIGTLFLTEKGLQFATANAKKSPQRLLPWNALHGLMVSGLFD